MAQQTAVFPDKGNRASYSLGLSTLRACCGQLGLGILAGVCVATAAQAQQPPDAGFFARTPPAAGADRAPPAPVLPAGDNTPVGPLPGGPTVTLQAVDLAGNTLLDSQDILAALGDFADKPYDMAGLQGLVQKVQDFYRRRGYPFVHVFMPPQNLASGRLMLQIVEARYGEIEVRGQPEAVALTRPYLYPLQSGDAIHRKPLERALLILSDMPGVRVASFLSPGERFGTSDLTVEVQHAPSWSWRVTADNHGNRYAGNIRINASVTGNSPLGLGDSLQARLTRSNEELWFGAVDYAWPVGSAGWRASVGIAHTDYTLADSFARLGARGTADVFTLGARYPFLLAAQRSLFLSAELAHKRLRDEYAAVDVQHRKRATSLTLLAQYTRWGDDWDGDTHATLALAPGRLEYDGALADADIASNAGRRGGFAKLGVDVTRLQRLVAGKATLRIRVAGQLAGKNLDSSEKFSLGGSSGIRAYPPGEAAGDDGWLAQLELAARLTPTHTPYLFYDLGEVKLNADPGRILPAVKDNTRRRAGAGLGLRHQGARWHWDVAAAWRTEGGRPESDSRDRQPRLWLSAGYRF